jgi:hypothetical protein
MIELILFILVWYIFGIVWYLIDTYKSFGYITIKHAISSIFFGLIGCIPFIAEAVIYVWDRKFWDKKIIVKKQNTHLQN